MLPVLFCALTAVAAAQQNPDVRICNSIDPSLANERVAACTRLLSDPSYVNSREAIYVNRGVAYKNLGQYKRALPDLDRSLQLNPKYANAYDSRGFVYGKLGQYKRALQDINQAIRLDQTVPDIYSHRAVVREKLGDHAGAKADRRKAQSLKKAGKP